MAASDPRAEAEAHITTWEQGQTKERLDSVNLHRMARRSKRSQMTKNMKILGQVLDDPNSTYIELEFAMQKVSTSYRELEEKDDAVWCAINHIGISDQDGLLGQHYYTSANRLICKTKETLMRINPVAAPLLTNTGSPSQTSPAASPVSVKLPKVELPDFFGTDPAEYQTFIAQFNSLVHDGPADKVQKLLYLKACCKGEAKKVADGFTVSQQNYDELYQVLKNTYGKPRLVIQSYVNRILNLEPFKMAGLKHHLNVLEASLRCLAEYKIDPEGLAAILVPLTETKMPRELFAKWREVIHEDDSFSTTKLVSFLHEKQECMAPSQSSQEKGHSKETPKDVRPKTTALLTSQSEGAKYCLFCDKKGHGAQDCYALGKKPKEEREEFFKKNSLCFKCVEKGHQIRYCPNEPLHCKRCKKKASNSSPP